MATMKLTKRAVDALQPDPAGRVWLYDSELKGFGLYVLPSGRKVFVLTYRPEGSHAARRLTLGRYGPLTVDHARRLAQSHLGDIAKGKDPARERVHARRAPTVKELGLDYIAHVHAYKKRTTAVEYERLWKKHVLPSLGSTKVASVTVGDVERLHRKMRATPYNANRVLAMLGAFFTFAEKGRMRAAHDNPAHGVEFYPETARERFLTAKEFKALGDALARAERDGLPPAPRLRRRPKSEATAKHRPKSADTPIPADPAAVAAIRLLTLTGCRRGEILSLRWDAVDLDRGFLRLGDTKTGKSERPLGAAAAAILDGLPRLEGCPYVFPGTQEKHDDGTITYTHRKSIKRTWYAVRHAAKLGDVRLHDLRHSFASVPAIGGDSLLVIRSLLGHADIKTTQRYTHLGDDPAKAAADRTSNTIAAWLNGAETPVTPLRRGA